MPLRRSPRFIQSFHERSSTLNGVDKKPKNSEMSLRRSSRFTRNFHGRSPKLNGIDDKTASSEMSLRRSPRFILNFRRRSPRLNGSDNKPAIRPKPLKRRKSYSKSSKVPHDIQTASLQMSSRCLPNPIERSPSFLAWTVEDTSQNPNWNEGQIQFSCDSEGKLSKRGTHTICLRKCATEISGLDGIPEEVLLVAAPLRRSSRLSGEQVKEGEHFELERDEKEKKESFAVETPREARKEKRKRVEMKKKSEDLMTKSTANPFDVSHGWTDGEELMLKRAYLGAKPSPRFWKNVSKMVPGKSAEECFEKIHNDLRTPLQRQPRSRAATKDVSSIDELNFSALLNQEKPKRNNMAARKTARHLMQKYHLLDLTQEADHFSVLETSPPSFPSDLSEIGSPLISGISSTPGSVARIPPGKRLSKFNPHNQEDYTSPQVLKRIKNAALHGKYIDYLHRRGLKTTFAALSLRTPTFAKRNNIGNVRASLASEAKDVISQFQRVQANLMLLPQQQVSLSLSLSL